MSEWKRVKLRDCVEEVDERTTENNQYEVLTSSKSGIYSQEDYFDKQVASKDNTGYKIIKRGQFTYRSMSDNGTFTINRLENKDIGIVSPAYPVFEAIDINAEYLKYFFQSEGFRKEIYNLSQGSTRAALKYRDLSNIEILLPPIEEQEKIVKILKNIDSIIKKYKNLLEEKNQFIKSQFVEMFENEKYPKKTLSELTDKITDGSHNPPTGIAENEGYMMLSSQNIINNSINYDNVRYLKKEDFEKENRRTDLQKGDVLLTIVGTVGRTAIMTEESNIVLQRSVAVIKPNKEINSAYLVGALNSESVINQLNKGAKGVAQKGIYLNDLKKIIIKVPPIELQNQFADIVKQIDKQKFLLDKQKQNYEKLKKGIMQKLLTGKVRVKI